MSFPLNFTKALKSLGFRIYCSESDRRGIIGESEVGKTAIIKGLAQRIVAGDVPDSLRTHQIIVLVLRQF